MPRPTIYQVQLADDEVRKVKVTDTKKQLLKRSVYIVRSFLIWTRTIERY